MSKFQNYTHFKNYCFEIMRNNELKITNQINQVFTEFEKVEHVWSALKEEGVIDYTKGSLEYVVFILQVSNMKTTLNCIKYLTEKVTNMLNGEVNISYLHTSLNSMIGMETFFRKSIYCNALIKKAAVPKIRFHDLCHTHATLLLAKGVNMKVISERLGHSNIKITLDTYSHVLPTMQEDAVNKIEEIL